MLLAVLLAGESSRAMLASARSLVIDWIIRMMRVSPQLDGCLAACLCVWHLLVFSAVSGLLKTTTAIATSSFFAAYSTLPPTPHASGPSPTHRGKLQFTY